MENNFDSLETYWKQHHKDEESKNSLTKDMIREMLASRTKTIFEKLKIYISFPMGIPLLMIINLLFIKDLSAGLWRLAIIIPSYGFIFYTLFLNYKALHILTHGKLSEDSIATTVNKMLKMIKKLRNYNYYFYIPAYVILFPIAGVKVFRLIFPEHSTIIISLGVIVFLVFAILYLSKIKFLRNPEKATLGSIIKELETTSIELKN